MGVEISYDDLGVLYTNLLAISIEFDAASRRSRDLAEDVGRPYGDGALRSLSRDFESGWDDRRNKLNDGLKQVSQYAKDILEGFGDFDVQVAADMAAAMQEVD